MKTKTIKTGVFGITVHMHGNEGTIESALHDPEGSKEFNAMMDAIESMVLAHALAGVDITSHAYMEGLETALDACGNLAGGE